MALAPVAAALFISRLRQMEIWNINHYSTTDGKIVRTKASLGNQSETMQFAANGARPTVVTMVVAVMTRVMLHAQKAPSLSSTDKLSDKSKVSIWWRQLTARGSPSAKLFKWYANEISNTESLQCKGYCSGALQALDKYSYQSSVKMMLTHSLTRTHHCRSVNQAPL